MGGSVSAGRNNEELVDNLIEVDLIKSQTVERVFRAVDRGTFYLPKHKASAYRDLAWREGNIHISAPCVYSRVMEALELRPNQSFLNVGSGTGYISSMVGLILGPYGVNHNIEIHGDVVAYAKQKVAEFVKTSGCFDDFDFCAPKFFHGNVFDLMPSDDMLLYDRIYVGAAANEQQERFLKSFLKQNGLLVLPSNDSLLKIRRVDQNSWETNTISTVSYASLVGEDEDTDENSKRKLKLRKSIHSFMFP
jgi:protein-L-isoaspartate O-methyltransferase